MLYVTVLLTNGPGRPRIYFRDPDGALIDSGIGSAILATVDNLRLTKTGTYTVGVVDHGLNEFFDYLISFNLAACGVNQREPEDD